jgi:hypothetical protein
MLSKNVFNIKRLRKDAHPGESRDAFIGRDDKPDDTLG